jgi:hypothetical protein
MKYDPHPLHPAQIQPAPEPYQVDPLSRRVHERDGTRVHGRALPTAETTHHHPRWRWGKPVDRPSTSGAPVIMSPSDLEPQRTPDPSVHGDIQDVVRRLKP